MYINMREVSLANAETRRSAAKREVPNVRSGHFPGRATSSASGLCAAARPFALDVRSGDGCWLIGRLG
jgi:hypothetical protein